MPHFILYFKTDALRDRVRAIDSDNVLAMRIWHERFYAWLTRRAMEAGA